MYYFPIHPLWIHVFNRSNQLWLIFYEINIFNIHFTAFQIFFHFFTISNITIQFITGKIVFMKIFYLPTMINNSYFFFKNNYSTVHEIIYKILMNSNLYKNVSYFIIQIFFKIRVNLWTYILNLLKKKFTTITSLTNFLHNLLYIQSYFLAFFFQITPNTLSQIITHPLPNPETP